MADHALLSASSVIDGWPVRPVQSYGRAPDRSTMLARHGRASLAAYKVLKALGTDTGSSGRT